MLGGAIFDGADGLAHLEFEVFEERGELDFEFASAIAQLNVAFTSEFGAELVESVLLLAGGLALGFKLGDFVVKALKEAGDVDLLGAETLAGGGDNFGVEPEARGGLNACGSAGNA